MSTVLTGSARNWKVYDPLQPARTCLQVGKWLVSHSSAPNADRCSSGRTNPGGWGGISAAHNYPRPVLPESWPRSCELGSSINPQQPVLFPKTRRPPRLVYLILFPKSFLWGARHPLAGRVSAAFSWKPQEWKIKIHSYPHMYVHS